MDVGRIGSGPDEGLVAEIESGSELALAEVYRRHGALVLALARRMLGDRSLAADVVQDVFVELWDDPLAFDWRVGSLQSHLLVRARDHSLERLGRLDGHPPTGAATHGLDDDERDIIEMVFLHGRSCREVSQLLDVPEQLVKRRIGFGLRRLGLYS